MPISLTNLNQVAHRPGMDRDVKTAMAVGSTEVWYRRENAGMLFGIADPDIADLNATHVLLGTIACKDPENVFYVMQGHVWSRQGEANDMVSALGCHTSMSVGDLAVIDGHVHIVRGMGFEDLGERELVPLVAIVTDDGYLRGATEVLDVSLSDAYWPQEFREGDDWDIITIEVPSDMVAPLVAHGTSEQEFSDGYSAWQEVLKRGTFNERD